MNTDRIYPHFAEAHEAVVTYSRVPPRPAARKRSRGLAVVERVEPRLEAAEVPLIDPHDEVDAAFAAPRPDLRADAVDAAPAARAGRGGSMRVVLLGAALAIIAGVAVLAGTIGLATIIPGGGPAAEAPLRLVGAETAPDVSADVREIPLATGEEAAAAEARATPPPPLPRPRPEVKAASLEPEAAVPVPQAIAASEPVVTEAPDPEPAASVDVEASLPAAMASDRQLQDSDALIMSIEETLQKIDSAPGDAPTAGVAVAPPAVLPPQLEPLPPLPLPTYPPVDDGCPQPGAGFDPCYDVMPPPSLSDNGYYRSGPVPPAPVPYPYPPSDSDDGAIVAEDSASAGDVPNATTERRPGIVRRVITRTADAVGRAFSRDND